MSQNPWDEIQNRINRARLYDNLPSLIEAVQLMVHTLRQPMVDCCDGQPHPAHTPSDDQNVIDQREEIREEDLEFEYYQAADQPIHEGPRGVQMTYLPTGIVYTASHHKSQLMNTADVIRQLREAL